MSQNLQPPSFISDTKTFSEYKTDLEIWSRLVTTSLDKKLQAEMVVYHLDGHPSRIKEKILTQIGDKLQGDGNVDGITVLLNFLLLCIFVFAKVANVKKNHLVLLAGNLAAGSNRVCI